MVLLYISFCLFLSQAVPSLAGCAEAKSSLEAMSEFVRGRYRETSCVGVHLSIYKCLNHNATFWNAVICYHNYFRYH